MKAWLPLAAASVIALAGCSTVEADSFDCSSGWCADAGPIEVPKVPDAGVDTGVPDPSGGLSGMSPPTSHCPVLTMAGGEDCNGPGVICEIGSSPCCGWCGTDLRSDWGPSGCCGGLHCGPGCTCE
jgi:hypothetical protein